MACEYELERERRIAANRAKMAELGIDESVAAMTAMVAPKPAAPTRLRKRPATPPPAEPIRRSGRARNEIDYAVMAGEIDRMPGLSAREPMDYSERVKALAMNPEEAEVLRAEFEERRRAQAARCGDGKGRGPKDSGKGVRVQGGRVYDSAFGVTCHWCRQKTLEAHVTCTHPGCGAHRMPYSFCNKCLKNRHGEDAEAAAASGCWVCPACRGSCGPGCIRCCNCGPCRKKAKLEPTAQILPLARSNGFTNVHDYLVHLVTGEDEEEIWARKAAAPWGAFLRGGADPASDDSAGTRAAAGAGGSSGKADEEEGEPTEPEDDGLEGMEDSGEEEEGPTEEDGSSSEEEQEKEGSEEEAEEVVAAVADAGVEEEAPAQQAGRGKGARRGAAAARGGGKAAAPAAGKPPRPAAGRGAAKSSKAPGAKETTAGSAGTEPVTAPRPARPSPPVDAAESLDQESKQSSSRKARMMARMGLTPRAGSA